jgi:hypothetical protein
MKHSLSRPIILSRYWERRRNWIASALYSKGSLAVPARLDNVLSISVGFSEVSIGMRSAMTLLSGVSSLGSTIRSGSGASVCSVPVYFQHSLADVVVVVVVGVWVLRLMVRV